MVSTSSIKSLSNLTGGLSLLYVEDDLDMRETTTTVFKLLFERVEAVTDGETALQKYRESEAGYDLVITDLTLPNMTGIELLQEIRTVNIEQAVIISSAKSEPDTLLQAIFEGVNGYILKPIDMGTFVPTLRKVAKQIFEKVRLNEYNHNLQNLISIQEEKIRTLDLLIKESNRIDNLTGIGNSIYLFERFHQIYNSDQNWSAMIFDINKFNSINNAYGMQYGDSLLKKVAKILKHIFIGDRFDLFRLESDKFVLLVRDPVTGEEQKIAEKIEQTFLDNTFLLKNDIVITVRLIIGILTHIEREQDIVSKLIRVLSELKFDKHKKLFYLYYDPESQFVKRQEENIIWMDRIRRVIEKRDVYPVFQPIVENRTGNIRKFESLMRIKYDGEFISPFHFLEPATVLGLLPQLTRIIIEKTFQKFDGTEYQFSINISEDDIAENYLLQFIPEMLEKYDVKPSQVILEILENMTTQEQLVLDHLEVLKDIGVQIAIDDFGSENSNFGRLSNIKANIIKIDGSFIKNMDLNLENRKIVKSIIFLAKELGAETVAEFVHNEAIHELTKELGIDYAQGFYLGAPKMDITNIEGE